MGTMPIQTVKPSGHNVALAAVAAQDVIETAGDDRIMLRVANGGGGSINATIVAVTTTIEVAGVGDLTIPDIVVAVPAGEERSIGPFNKAYRDPDGTVTINYSATASVTAAAVKLDRPD